jgi:hypothetical protein
MKTVKMLVAVGVTAGTLALISNGGLAGSNSCFGVVSAGPKWSTITETIVGQRPYVCQFLTSSKIGRQILAKCPDGTTCNIEMPLPPPQDGSSINRVTKMPWQIERMIDPNPAIPPGWCIYNGVPVDCH